jgi:3-deoxy-manno-octulosonate cytidylyltransferase (CMP-KDO synthetase)
MIQGALESTRYAPIGTVAAPLGNVEDMNNPAVVKIAHTQEGRALYFSRSAIPHGYLKGLHHIGIYAFHYSALKTFVSLPPSPLEVQERLEQLRALEAGMAIHVTQVSSYPISIDTPEDYARLLTMAA